MHVLVLEAQPAVARQVRSALETVRLEVTVSSNGVDGLRLARHGDYDLLVVDRDLPERTGFQVCEALRRHRVSLPILMLTRRDSVEERIAILEAGADQHLLLPFDARELAAHARALLRRDQVHRSRVVSLGDLEVDTVAGTVRRGGHEIHLTPREYALLEALARNEGRILTRDEILERVWMDHESCSNTVSVHVLGLRRKIDQGHDVKLIHTVIHRGYVLRGPGSPADTLEPTASGC